jgi:hypothetical protein
MSVEITIQEVNEEINNSINQGEIVEEETEPFVFEWKLELDKVKTSIFENKKMVEYVDICKVQGFIKNKMGISYGGIRRYEKLEQKFKNELEWMKSYKNLYNREIGGFETGFYLPKYKYGRVLPNNYLSMSIAHRQTRHSLCDSAGYIDIDMVSCQPVLISEICRHHNINLEGLNYYVNNRDYVLNQIMEYYGVSRDSAKKLPLILMFGGTYQTWKDEYNIEKNDLDLILKIENEMITVMNTVYRYNKDTIEAAVLKEFPDKWRTLGEKKRGVMALFCQTTERLIQESVIEFLVKNRNVVLEQVIPCQDGFMIPKRYHYETIIEDIEKVVRDSFNINIQFKIKPFDEKIEIPIFEDTKTYHQWNDCLSYVHLSNRFLEEYDNYLKSEIINNGNFIYYIYWGYRESETFIFNEKTLIKHTGDMVNPRWYVLDNNNIGMNKFIDYLVYDFQYKIKMELLESLILTDGEREKLYNKLTNMIENIENKNMLRLIQTRVKQAEKPFNSDKHLLGFENGVLDILTGQFRNYLYTDFMTTSTGYNYYKPIYHGETEESIVNSQRRDLLHQLLNEIQPVESERLLLSQIFASSLDGNNYSFCFMFNGSGGNGKGVSDILLRNVLGVSNYYDSPPVGLLNDMGSNSNGPSPMVMDLKHKRYINFKETGSQSIKKSVLKLLTGGDPIKARGLHQRAETFTLNSTVVMEFNEAPEITGKCDQSDYRRIIHILFPQNYTLDERKIDIEVNEHGYTYKRANPLYQSEVFGQEMKYVFLDYLLDIYKQSVCIDGSKFGIRFDIPEHVRLRSEAFIQKNMDVFNTVFHNNWEKIENKEEIRNHKIKFKDMWDIVKESSEIKSLSKADKRLYNREAFEIWIKNTAKLQIQSVDRYLFVLGVRIKEEEYEEEENNNIVYGGAGAGGGCLFSA